jgi:hypothetical protein
MDNIQEMAAMTALNKMFKKGYFDICTIDSVADIMKVNTRGGREYTILRALHCVDYKDMPKELYDELPQLIQSCLGISPIFEFEHLKQKRIVVSPFRRIVGLLGSKEEV